jgi:predicted GNAT family acetyltransferase
MTSDFHVQDRPERRRYELTDGGELIAWADYSVDGETVVVPHVETVVAHRGQGNAARLMDGVVEDLRATGRAIRPICSFAAAYLRARPDTHDLVDG